MQRFDFLGVFLAQAPDAPSGVLQTRSRPGPRLVNVKAEGARSPSATVWVLLTTQFHQSPQMAFETEDGPPIDGQLAYQGGGGVTPAGPFKGRFTAQCWKRSVRFRPTIRESSQRKLGSIGGRTAVQNILA